MLTTLIAAALAAAAPAADPHAGHHPAGHSDTAGHGGKGCCEHESADGKAMDCCIAKAGAAKAACCAEHEHSGHHGSHK